MTGSGSTEENKYAGSELDLFANALNWKAYWSTLIRPFLGRKILDVGAGIGASAKVLARIECERYFALEPDELLVSRMKKDAASDLFHQNFEVGAGTSASLGPDELFDTILFIDVLEHIDNDKEELARSASHLMPGGRIVVLSPAHQWLFTAFDKAIGHFRRYDKAGLLAIKPPELALEHLFYLDSVGMLASLGNRFVLRSGKPTIGQIALWDGWMVPVSRTLDRMTGYRVGKSIVGVFRKPD
jgi:SAM-dependent methyltransferase